MKYLTLLFTFFLSINAYTQWTDVTDLNTLVVTDNSGDMKSVGTSTGHTYVVYWKVVASPINYELRLQVLDNEGYQQLGENGLLISNTLPMSTFTNVWSVVVDDNDDLYIGVTGSNDGSGHAFKLDIDGNHLWGANGITLDETGYVVTILPLNNGEAIVSWLPNGQAKMQKYDTDGNAVWDSPQTVISGTSNTSPANLFELTGGYYMLVFHELGFGINSTLYAQKYDSLGIAQWTEPTQLSNKSTAYIASYSGTQDSNVVYYGYFASSSNRFDSFLQRINSDGNLPWGINGKDFDTNETDYEMDTKVAYYPGSDYVWEICTYTDPNQANKGEYVQKFDKVTGNRELSETAHEVYPISVDDKMHASPLHLINDQPLFVLKTGFDNGATAVTLDYIKLDENGDFAWEDEIEALASYSASKSRISMTAPVNDQAVVVFIEDKGNGDQIYAQSYSDVALSIENMIVEQLHIYYANPIDDELRILSDSFINEIVIYDLLGKVIFNNTSVNSTEASINSQRWDNGLYLMTIKTEKGIKKGLKIIRQ